MFVEIIDLESLVMHMVSKRKLLKKSDMVLIAVLLALALALYFLHYFLNRSQNKVVAEILADGQVELQISLDQDNIFSLEGHPNVVFEIRSNGIAFQASDCPDQVCVHSGFMKQAGQMAACLPNNMAVRVVGQGAISPDAPDVVA